LINFVYIIQYYFESHNNKMGYSFKKLQANFWKYVNSFYNYLLYAIYWGTVPSIIMYGLFAKPGSPLVHAVWGFLSGKEEQQQ